MAYHMWKYSWGAARNWSQKISTIFSLVAYADRTRNIASRRQVTWLGFLNILQVWRRFSRITDFMSICGLLHMKVLTWHCRKPVSNVCSHHLRDIFFLRDIPSARHFNRCDIPFSRLFRCATSHLQENPVAPHFSCVISHLRDLSSAWQPILATFFFTFWKPRWTSLIWLNLTKPNLIYALSSLA